MTSKYTTKDYMTVFDLIDTDKNGFIDKQEFRNYMITKTPFCHCKNPSETVDISFQLIDQDMSGEIDFQEFLRFMLILQDKPFEGNEKLEFYFKLVDDDNSGKIEFNEIKRVLAALEKDCDMESCIKEFKKYDLNENGELSFDEFKRLFYK